MSRVAGRTYPPRRRHRSPGAVSSAPTRPSIEGRLRRPTSPLRAFATPGGRLHRRLSFCPDARRPPAANFRFFLSSSSPGRILAGACMYDGGARWRAAPGGCPDLRPAAASLTDRSMRQRCGATRHRHPAGRGGATRHRHPAGRGRIRSPAFPVHASVCPRRHMLRSVLRLVKRKTKNHLGTKQKRMFRMNVELVLFI